MIKQLYFATAAAALVSYDNARAANPRRLDHPNIIYINADDLGVMDVHFNGRKEYNTPNLDKLAAQGMIFTDAYAPAANCAPSRAACISGQYSPRTGVYTVGSSSRGASKLRKIIPIKNTKDLADENITLAEALKSAGYATIHLGKWHLGDDPLTQGFDVNIGGDRTGSPTGGYFAPFKKGSMKKYNSEYKKGTHRADIFADQAGKFIDSHKDKPFFMYMAYYSVHTGLQAVPEYVKKYKNVKGINPAYASMIEKMDESVGKILKKLDETGLADKTLVLFTSDNGGVINISRQTPYRSGKGSYFEGGIRVPMCVRWPGHVPPGTKCDVPVSGVDIYPTFLAAANAPVPKGKILDGESLIPLLTQKGAFKDRAVYWHFPIYLEALPNVDVDAHDPYYRTRPGTAMRYKNWKLHEYFENGDIELYDLNKDAGERGNIASEMPEKVKELHEMMKKWRKEINAPVPTELNPGYDPDFVPKRKSRRK